MTRIAVVTTSYPRYEGDPSGHFVRAEVRALEREGAAVRVFAPRGDAFGWPGVLPRIRERPARAVSAAIETMAMRRELLREGPWDRVIAHWLPTALLARGVKAPLTVVAHGSDVRMLASLPLFGSARAHALEILTAEAAIVRVVSAALGEALLACARGAERSRLEARLVVEAATIELDGIRTRAAVDASKRFEGRKLAVTVGRLIPGKRVDRVLAHVATDREWKLVVVGDGPERGRLEGRARWLGVDASFVGLVPRDDALAWIASADALFHASEAEGLSTVIREAEALGTPVVWM